MKGKKLKTVIGEPGVKIRVNAVKVRITGLGEFREGHIFTDPPQWLIDKAMIDKQNRVFTILND